MVKQGDYEPSQDYFTHREQSHSVRGAIPQKQNRETNT